MRLLRSIVRTLVVAFALAGWALALAAIHIVRLQGGMVGVVPKNRLGLVDTYVDVRSWTAADAAKHPDFVKRLIEGGKTDWLASVVGVPGGSLDAALNDLLNSTSSTTKPAAIRPKPAKRARP